VGDRFARRHRPVRDPDFERHAIFNAARFLLALTPPFLALFFVG
jgi:hypothetical protein